MSIAKHILVIEPDPDLRGILLEQLKTGGEFSLTGIAALAQGLGAEMTPAFDLILLSGEEKKTKVSAQCQQLRDANLNAPIILLAAAELPPDDDDESDIADRVTKPFRIQTLLTRMRVQLRLHDQSESAKIDIGPYDFHPAFRQLVERTGHTIIRLTEKEALILRYLYRAGDKPVARETLLSEVWGYNAGVTTHTLETHIYRLRQKIEPDSAKATILLTDPGGYRLNAHT